MVQNYKLFRIANTILKKIINATKNKEKHQKRIRQGILIMRKAGF
jgi:hypothetical protein